MARKTAIGKPAAVSAPAAAATTRFPIVGIGASAGGLEALKELLDNMPAHAGMALVIVTHQHPGHTSLLPELLAKDTTMPMVEAGDGTLLAPDHVYLGPPGGHLEIRRGRLYVTLTPSPVALRQPIDHFFRSLAVDRREHAIGIVLSGTGADGTLGLKAIKGASGMGMVQQPDTARYAGMPSSAIATGVVDYVLPVAGMPRQLMAYVAGPYLQGGAPATGTRGMASEPFEKLLQLLRGRSGHDFSAYKVTMIHRRVERRMSLHQIDELERYVQYLQQNTSEIDLLFKELLINVTRFFRDPESFDALIACALAKYLDAAPELSALRVWVPGCSSGEEVYSLAISLREYMDRSQRSFEVQLFGTDLDVEAIEAARKGYYPDSIEADVSRQRLQRWFTRGEGGYRICKQIRSMAIFAPQNLIQDPPFSKLDVVSCRNVMIYLGTNAQQRLLATFGYALKPRGLLQLGSSETIGRDSHRFETLDKKWRIFRRKPGSDILPQVRTFCPAAPTSDLALAPMAAAEPKTIGISSLIERQMLTRFVPASVVFNERGDIIFLHGRTGTWLELAAGRPRLNVVEMARDGLKYPLASAIRQVNADGQEVAQRNLTVKSNGHTTQLDLLVCRITEPEAIRGLLIATFQTSPEPAEPVGQTGRSRRAKARCEAAGNLQRELQQAKESLQVTVDDLETANEKLTSSVEEMQSSNEELQSANEELQTSQEELQSMTEELNSVNAELHLKVEELGRIGDDMQNLLDSTDIATVFLDQHLNIGRYTETATALIHLIPSDVGRPISDLVSKLGYQGLSDDCREVLRTLTRRTTEVQTTDGAWYLMRIIPYRTMHHTIDGVVITFVNIDSLKAAQHTIAARERYFESVVTTLREPLLLLDQDLRVAFANPAFYRFFRLEPEQVKGMLIYRLSKGAWDVSGLRKLLEEILPQNASFEAFELEHEFPGLGLKRLLLNARRLERSIHLPGLVLLAIEDATGRSDMA